MNIKYTKGWHLELESANDIVGKLVASPFRWLWSENPVGNTTYIRSAGVYRKRFHYPEYEFDKYVQTIKRCNEKLQDCLAPVYYEISEGQEIIIPEVEGGHLAINMLPKAYKWAQDFSHVVKEIPISLLPQNFGHPWYVARCPHFLSKFKHWIISRINQVNSEKINPLLLKTVFECTIATKYPLVPCQEDMNPSNIIVSPQKDKLTLIDFTPGLCFDFWPICHFSYWACYQFRSNKPMYELADYLDSESIGVGLRLTSAAALSTWALIREMSPKCPFASADALLQHFRTITRIKEAF